MGQVVFNFVNIESGSAGGHNNDLVATIKVRGKAETLADLRLVIDSMLRGTYNVDDSNIVWRDMR